MEGTLFAIRSSNLYSMASLLHMSDFQESKQALREQLKITLRNLPASYREEAAAKACALLSRQPLWQNVKSILFFAPLPSELNLWALIPTALQQGKTILLPRFDPVSQVYEAVPIQDVERDVAPGRFNILEPLRSISSIPLKQLDLLLVPGLAFDPHGGRLGRGGGFYDRLLAQIAGVKCGVAFDEQIVSRVPTEPHDIQLDCLLTSTRWLSVHACAE